MRIKLDARGTANVAKMREMMEGMDGLRSLMEQMQQALIELQAETLSQTAMDRKPPSRSATTAAATW